jgi:hypothetical protein
MEIKIMETGKIETLRHYSVKRDSFGVLHHGSENNASDILEGLPADLGLEHDDDDNCWIMPNSDYNDAQDYLDDLMSQEYEQAEATK